MFCHFSSCQLLSIWWPFLPNPPRKKESQEDEIFPTKWRHTLFYFSFINSQYFLTNIVNWIAYAKNTNYIDNKKFSLLGCGWKYSSRLKIHRKPMKCIINSHISHPSLKRCTPPFQQHQWECPEYQWGEHQVRHWNMIKVTIHHHFISPSFL